MNAKEKWSGWLDKFVDWFIGVVGVLSLVTFILGGLSKVHILCLITFGLVCGGSGDPPNEFDLIWWEFIFLAVVILISARYSMIRSDLKNLQRRYLLYESKVDIHDYDEAIRLGDLNPQNYYSRGLAYHHLGQYERALEDHDEAIRLNPQNGQYYYNRGLTHQALWNLMSAPEDFAKAEELGYEPP